MPERSLPSGMVAFLFSDIEGSTALLRRVGGDYRHHLGQYRALLLDVFEQHNGSPLGSEETPFLNANERIFARLWSSSTRTSSRTPWTSTASARNDSRSERHSMQSSRASASTSSGTPTLDRPPTLFGTKNTRTGRLWTGCMWMPEP